MLQIIQNMWELNAEQLMAVYRESNQESGKKLFPDCDTWEQLLRAETAFLSYLREDFFRQRGAMYCVWTVEGRYVAALRLEPYNDGLLLEALETVPDARRKGYATDLLLETLMYLRTTDWAVVCSHVEKKNTASLGVHKKCGFQRVSESATYIDGTVTQNSCTFQYCLKEKPPA